MAIINSAASVTSTFTSALSSMASKSYLDEQLINKSEYRLKNNCAELDLTPDNISSSLLNEEVLRLLETIKNILVSNNIVSKEQFAEEYNKVCKNFEDKIEQQKIANKLENK